MGLEPSLISLLAALNMMIDEMPAYSLFYLEVNFLSDAHRVGMVCTWFYLLYLCGGYIRKSKGPCHHQPRCKSNTHHIF
jgi:hypothetical protein